MSEKIKVDKQNQSIIKSTMYCQDIKLRKVADKILPVMSGLSIDEVAEVLSAIRQEAALNSKVL